MAVSLTSNVLITEQTLVDYYGKKVKNADQSWEDFSGSYNPLINQASEAFHTEVYFNVFSGSLQNERFEGDDTSEHYVDFAVDGFSDVHVYDIFYLEGPATTDLVNVTSGSSAYAWQYEADTGLIRFTDGNRFHSHPRDIDNWWVRYHYGLEGPVSGSVAVGRRVPVTQVPQDIQDWVCQEVWRLNALRDHSGFESATTAGGISKSYNLDFRPKEMENTLNKYRRYV